MEDKSEKPINNGINTVKRNEKGQIVAGSAPLNPDGKPKGTKHFSTIFMEELRKEIKLKDKSSGIIETMKAGEAMSRAMIRKAISGDVQAFNAVADRVDGKPKNETDITVTEMPSPIMPINRKRKVIIPIENDEKL